jgi:hypothetical protein
MKTPPSAQVAKMDAAAYFGRQAIGDRDKLIRNADGLLNLYIQAASPGHDKETNWLPVAMAPFTLLLRLYSPKREFLQGRWTPPPVRRVN